MSSSDSSADSSALRAAIERLVEQNWRNDMEVARYWYPLALPTYGASEVADALDAMCRFKTSMGPRTTQFERAFADWQECADAVMVNSGSSADLLLCLLLTNPRKPLLKAGDEVLVPVVTWPTQIWSPMMAGLSVRLVDADPDTLNVDIDDLEASITPKTKAIFLVHVLGNPCNMDRILQIAAKHGLQIIEDCCEAMGSRWGGKRVGNFGVGGVFSFFFSHHITTMEGGMVSLSEPGFADDTKIMRAHGWVRNVETQQYDKSAYPEIDPRYAFVNWGLNVRPTELQAAFGLHQLAKVPEFADRRAAMANSFRALIEKSRFLSVPRVDPKAEPSWLALPVMVNADAPFTRGDITAYLEKHGVETRPVITGNLARHPVADIFPSLRSRSFPGADQIHERGFYIGLSPCQTQKNVDRLLETFSVFLAQYGS
jgi:CDP-6-deoxy-D-xylo-4-hexulose-3-dehydrase